MRRVDTIYFGGGTPTTLTVGQISSLIDACRNAFDVAPDSEITAEANPGSISQNYLEELRLAGVNRLSFGAQSFDEGELRMIGRTHSAEDARAAIRTARAAGFANLSLDLIAGLPEQKMETWRRNLEEVFALSPDHVSVYMLELYKDAPLLHRINRGELRAIDDELTVEMYFALMDEAERRGFEHYEISNWARPGFESRHNLKYWIGAPYWAFGVSAAGYDGQARWSNTRNIHEYLAKIESGQTPLAERVELDDDDRQSENLFLRLRLKDGVDLNEHFRRFGVDALERYRDEIERLREAGLIELGENRLKISRAGTVLANEVFAAFV
jgi:oxygen-independent coproporphyrinogen-3 oxidase